MRILALTFIFAYRQLHRPDLGQKGGIRTNTIDYNLAYIPVDFHPERKSEFDSNYMNEEFNLAYKLARFIEGDRIM